MDFDLNIIYVVLIATLVKSQESVVTPNNGITEKVGVAFRPASITVGISANRISEEDGTTVLANSNEDIMSNPSQNVITDENAVPVEVEAITTDPSNGTIVSLNTESSSLITNPSNKSTAESMEADLDSTEAALNNTYPNLTQPSISTTDIFKNTESSISEPSLYTNEFNKSITTSLPPTIINISQATEVPSIIYSQSTATEISKSTTTSMIPSTMDISKATKPTSTIYLQATTTEPPKLSATLPPSSNTLSSLSTMDSSKETKPTSLSTTAEPPKPITSYPQSSSTSAPSLCGENEAYSCLPICPRTCNNPLSKVICLPVPRNVYLCRRGCTCVTGYLLEKSIGKCVKECPATVPLDRPNRYG